MPTKTLLTSVNSDSTKGRRYVEICRAQYDGEGLDETRAQFLNENHAFAAGLRELIARCSMSVQAPKGGSLYIIRVPVNPARDWNEAINAAGPNTGSDWAVRKVGDQYPVQQGETGEHEIVLVNFGKTIKNISIAIDWAQPYGLEPEPPRGVFAIAEHKPRLHRELNVDSMAIVSPVECSFEGRRHVPDSWLNDDCRVCYLRWPGDEFDADYWFAFSRKKSSISAT